MAEGFKILHISDLHFSPGRHRDASENAHSIAMLQGIEEALNQESPVDLVVISGDITDQGDLNSLQTARDWIFGSINIGSGIETGLRRKHSDVCIVPGNHDAFNAPTHNGSVLSRRQVSVENFNVVFKENAISRTEGCDYDFIEKNGNGLFLAYVDSCFLGEAQLKMPFLDDTARGKLSVEQSEWLLHCYDIGIQGRLTNPRNQNVIPSDLFARSFKALVMHHYLLDPSGLRTEYVMNIKHRKVVTKNLALADFDVLLCGHKHHIDFHQSEYGNHFDRRAVDRYLMNYFRRIIGLNSLPIQYADEKGRWYSKPYSALLNIVALMVSEESTETAATNTEVLLEILRSGITDPKSLEKDVTKYIQRRAWHSNDVVPAREIHQLVRQINVAIQPKERAQLSKLAERIVSISKNLSSRPFIQVMTGSSAKNSLSQKSRSFNVYEIKANGIQWNLAATRYAWEWGEGSTEGKFKRTENWRNAAFSRTI